MAVASLSRCGTLLLLLTGSGSWPSGAAELVRELPAATELGLRVHGLSTRAGKDSVFSPLGLEVLLGMLREGAATKTLAQIDKALGWAGAEDAAKSALLARMTALRNPDGPLPRDPVLLLAQGLWPHTARPLEPAFETALREQFHAELTPLDFTQAHGASVAAINGWIGKQTQGRVSRLVSDSDVTADTTLVLASTVYFRGAWEHGFDPRLTRQARFSTSASETVPVTMMRIAGFFSYGQSETAQWISLPYSGGKHFLFLVLPRRTDGLATLRDRLSAELLSRLLAAQEWRTVRLQVPRFTIRHRVDLKEPLSTCGVTEAFDRQLADFSRLNGRRAGASADGCHIGCAVQEAVIEVTEQGTVAAAASGATGDPFAGGDERPKPPVFFVADRPFLFLVMGVETRDVLFVGQVANPQPAPR